MKKSTIEQVKNLLFVSINFCLIAVSLVCTALQLGAVLSVAYVLLFAACQGFFKQQTDAMIASWKKEFIFDTWLEDFGFYKTEMEPDAPLGFQSWRAGNESEFILVAGHGKFLLCKGVEMICRANVPINPVQAELFFATIGLVKHKNGLKLKE